MPSKYLAHAAGSALALVSSLAAAIAPEQILLQVSPSIVMVDISDIYGKPIEQRSGVVIGVGQVVTSCQAIQKDRNLQVWQDGSAFKARLQYSDTARDSCSSRTELRSFGKRCTRTGRFCGITRSVNS